MWFLKRLWCICWLDFLLPTKPCDWFLFQFLPRSQANQKWCHFFLPIGSQIVQESRIFSQFTFGILLIKPGVVLLTTQVTNKTDPNFPSLYARCQTLICSSTDFCRVAAPRVSSDHPGMKNISGEVSIFCLWTNWIHLLTCGKIEFRELYYLHFRSLCTRVVWPKIVFGLWRLKRRELENNQTIFETCVLNPLRGQKIKENLFWRKVKRTAFSESGTYVSYTISLC